MSAQRLAAHEFPDTDTRENRWCKWCGCLWHPQMTATCLQRAIPASELRPEPARREYACEAFEEIGKRLVEVAKESLPVESDPQPHMDPGDCCG